MNVLLEAPPSEQSVHDAVRMLMLLLMMSGISAGHALLGFEYHWHGTLEGSRTTIQTCSGSAARFFNHACLFVTTREGTRIPVMCEKRRRASNSSRQLSIPRVRRMVVA